MEKELVGENEISRFYKTSLTRSFDKNATPIGLKCLLVEKKDGSDADYIIINRKGEPIYNQKNFESISIYLDVKKRLAKR